MARTNAAVVGRYGRRWQRLVVVAALALVALAAAACGASAAPTATPTPTTPQIGGPQANPTSTPTSGPTATSTASFNAQWQALIAKAKQEGEVDIVAGGSASREFTPVADAFGKQFGIKVNFSTGSSHTQAARVLAERQKGIYSVDVAMTGANTSATLYIPAGAMDPVMNWLIDPNVLDTSKWYGGHFWWGDDQQKYNFLYAATVSNPPSAIQINTDLVKPADLNSMQDLLDPKWKGKIGSLPPTVQGAQEAYFEMYVDPDVGPTWVQHMIQDTNTFYNEDYRQLENALANGTIAICVFCGSTRADVDTMNQQGLPVENLIKNFKEPGVLVGAGSDSNIGIFNHPAHPAAAQLFLNWFLSTQGQTDVNTLAASPPSPSLRNDVPGGVTKPDQRREPGVNYPFPSADPALLNQRDAAVTQSEDWYNALTK